MISIDFWNSIESAAKNPTEANFLDLLQQLDNSIESSAQLDRLPAAGKAIEQLAAIYANRANAKFSEIKWLNNPQHEPIIPLSEFDRYVRQSSVLDLDRFMLDREHYYPENRADAVSIETMEREVLSAIVEDEDPLSIAHDEDIEAWVNKTLERMAGKPLEFSELVLSIPLAQAWLSVLLSNDRLMITRVSGEFYDLDGLILDVTF